MDTGTLVGTQEHKNIVKGILMGKVTKKKKVSKIDRGNKLRMNSQQRSIQNNKNRLPQLPKVIRGAGNLSIYKGKINSIQIAMWDALPYCTQSCSFFEECPHNILDQVDSDTIKCQLREKYLQSVFGTLTSCIEEDPMSFHKVGFMLIPLYSHLVSFKIEEHVHRNILNKGRVNAIYKEIRETIKLINSLLKDLLPEEEINQTVSSVNYVDGDSCYYDQLMEGEVIQP